MNIEFPKPKMVDSEKVEWELSKRTRNIVSHYATFANRDESEIVDEFLQNLLNNKDFIEWAKNKRNNKRILEALHLESESNE